jgi:hypothetical protein
MRTPRDVREHLLAWVLACVEDEPGIWTAALCRSLNGLPETEESVIWCGLCTEYANPRKRRRAAQCPPILPGFEEIGGAYQLHPPCGRIRLRLLRSLLSTLERATMVRGEPGSEIPDSRNHRGWDYATRWYPCP